jgi:hypothetical protein
MAQVSGCTCSASSGVTGTPDGCGVGPTIWAVHIIGQHRKPIAETQRAGDRPWIPKRRRAWKGRAGWACMARSLAGKNELTFQQLPRLQIVNCGAGLDEAISGIWLYQPGRNAQQRGFAGAICARPSRPGRQPQRPAPRRKAGVCRPSKPWGEFAPDSPLEGDGFEPSVPRRRQHF